LQAGWEKQARRNIRALYPKLFLLMLNDRRRADRGGPLWSYPRCALKGSFYHYNFAVQRLAEAARYAEDPDYHCLGGRFGSIGFATPSTPTNARTAKKFRCGPR